MTGRPTAMPPDMPASVQAYAAAYSGVDLAAHRLKELIQVAGLLVDAVEADSARIALGDDPHTFARTLEALRAEPRDRGHD